MTRRIGCALLLGLCSTLLLAGPARASFGLSEFDVAFTNANGTRATQGGSHPFQMTTTIGFETVFSPLFGADVPDGALKDLVTDLPVGLAGDPYATPRCTAAEFAQTNQKTERPNCPDSTAVGVIAAAAVQTPPLLYSHEPVYNLIPPPGYAAKLGFTVHQVPVTILLGVRESAPSNIVATMSNTSQVLLIYGARLDIWGNPADSRHDAFRGECLDPQSSATTEAASLGKCPAVARPRPFLTLPTSCSGALATHYEASSWQAPGNPIRGITETNDGGTPPNPLGTTDCSGLGFAPTIVAKPTTKAASSPTGLDFSLDVEDEGLTNSAGTAQSQIKRAVVTLPEGFSTNPSLAEGLATCSVTQVTAETSSSAPGTGCPDGSKIGTVEVESPLLEGQLLKGSLFIATPYENPLGSLLALYIVIKSPALGIVIRQPLEVQTNAATGQITTVADELPQLPFSHFRLHFREGTRSPLASPPGCGTYNASAVLTPWSGGPSITTTSTFQIITGSGAGPCPNGGAAPFHPLLLAGTLNNAAGSYSPFNTRIARSDSEQEITNFSIKLPPGIVGKLAGIPYCSDAQIADAKAREGQPHGGSEEIANPSCPAASEVGRSLAGAGVGPSLAYAPGKLYLAGPYHGSALSLVSITAAKVGPFDLGTVVVRFALKINPDTAEVFVDATGSDPIPHIIAGIPVHLRDIRAYVDRPEFVLNPTSCERTSTASTVLGSGLDFASAADNLPVAITSPFQAADCASLGFKPKLALSLKGGTKRGATPALKAVLTYPKGANANIRSAQVTLPHSEFLEQSHIRTICTRVLYAQGVHPGEKCPAASIYGRAKAITPILADPIEGPVYLRSSSHNLPDLVAALHNRQIDINLVGRIDSVRGGRIRNTFESVPDAPVTSFTLEMRGGKKGLLVNSANLCKTPKRNRVFSHFVGQNGMVYDTHPALRARCSKAGKAKKHHTNKAHRLARR